MTIVSRSLTADDSGVLKYTVSSKQLTKKEILTKLGYKTTAQQQNVKFDDFRLLTFNAEREVSIAVFEQELRVHRSNDQPTQVLVGHTDLLVKTTIFGSPLPQVVWYVDNTPITKGNQHFPTLQENAVEFYLTAKLARD